MPHPEKSRRSQRRWGLLGLVALIVVSTTGCTAREIFFLDMPEPVTEQGNIVSALWEGSWTTLWPIGFAVWGAMLFVIFVYSRRRNPDMPEQTAYHLPLEITYTIVPLILVFGLFFFTVRDQNDILRVDENPQNTVNVVGFRWSWAFNYTDEDVYDVGTPFQFPTLYLPVDENVRFDLTSPDVAHSFWVPDFLMKMDVIPGKLNQFQVTPNKVGEYAGKCAELCGVDHSRMLFNVKVVPRAEYEAHIAMLKERGQTGQLETGRTNRSGENGPEGKAL